MVKNGIGECYENNKNTHPNNSDALIDSVFVYIYFGTRIGGRRANGQVYRMAK